MQPRRVRHRLEERAGIRRRGDEPEPVAQPLQGGAGDEDAALEREDVVRRRCARPPSRASPSPGSGTESPTLTSRNEPGPVGVLGHARLDARLPEERRLLVAGDPADRHAQGRGTLRRRWWRSCRRSDGPPAGSPAGCRRARTARGRNHRGRGRRAASGSRCSRSVASTAPAVSRAISHVSTVASAELATLRARGERRILAKQPLQLRCGEVRVEQQSGPAPDLRLLAPRAMLGADRGAAPALPDDGGRDAARGSAGRRRRASRAGW